MTNIRKKAILVPYGMRREIARVLGVNERTVGRALRGETVGKKSDAVRRLAVKKIQELNLDPVNNIFSIIKP